MKAFNMTEDEIFEIIRAELRYQNDMTTVSSHVRPDLTEGECLLAIDELVSQAKTFWYSDTPPHNLTRNHIRKVAALCVRMCLDETGMPERNGYPPKPKKSDKFRILPDHLPWD